jgi:hypothetical protein
VFWGGPSLVHPETGVVFAIGIGTIGIVMRLPPHVVANVDPKLASVSQKFHSLPPFDNGPAGPEWRLIAYDYAPGCVVSRSV